MWFLRLLLVCGVCSPLVAADKVDLTDKLRQSPPPTGKMKDGGSCAVDKIYQVTAPMVNNTCSRISAIEMQNVRIGNNNELVSSEFKYPAGQTYVDPLQTVTGVFDIKLKKCASFQFYSNLLGFMTGGAKFTKPAAGPTFGYDMMGPNMDTEDPAGGPHHVSVIKNGLALADVLVSAPATLNDIWLTSADPAIVTPVSVLQGNTAMLLSMEAAKAETAVYANWRTATGTAGPRCDEIRTDVYKEKKVTARLFLMNGTGTAPLNAAPKATAAEVQTAINSNSYKRGVAMLDLDEGGEVTSDYDTNGDGVLNIEFRNGINTASGEFSVILTKVQSGPPALPADRIPVILVRKMYTQIPLTGAAAAGDTTVELDTNRTDLFSYDSSTHTGDSFNIGGPTNTRNLPAPNTCNGGMRITLTAAPTLTAGGKTSLTFTPALCRAIGTGLADALYWPAGAWASGSYVLLQQDSVGTQAVLIWTIGHELGHPIGGKGLGLKDLNEPLNQMYFMQGQNGFEMRFKELSGKYNPAPENQWQTIPRN